MCGIKLNSTHYFLHSLWCLSGDVFFPGMVVCVCLFVLNLLHDMK